MRDYDGDLRRLMDAAARTEVIRAPRQLLLTFGVTTLDYYVITEPSYSEVIPGPPEAVVRQGRVAAQRPTVVTPGYMSRLNGFGDDAYRYFGDLARQFGPNSPGLLYSYSNEPGEMNIVEGTSRDVAERINSRLTSDDKALSAVIRGVDELWDVSLLKFIFEYTMASISANVDELGSRGLMSPDPRHGVPRAAIHHIETLFLRAEPGDDPSELKRELDRWDLFDRYQDRFFGLFKRRAG